MSVEHSVSGLRQRQISQKIEVVSADIEGALQLGNLVLRYENEQIGDLPIVVDNPTHSYLKFILDNPNRPFLNSHIQNHLGKLYTGNDLHKKVESTFQDLPIKDNFVRVGRGKGTWYGFLPDSEDPSEFMQNGYKIIEYTERSDFAKKRRRKTFDKMGQFYSADREEHFTRQKTARYAGGTALAVVVGGVAWYAVQTYGTNHYGKSQS